MATAEQPDTPPRVGGAFTVGLTDDPRTPIAVVVHNPATAEQIVQINLEREEALTLAFRVLAGAMEAGAEPKMRMW